ncbi:Crp/Fnr family transcriptional regulator [Listeria booriae]|uniref:Crp/Fnr family transcriptional regulator n=1 Tax=Listeria booriae TaxID=1552123 RepID=A0A7X1DK80_9LIST|nr:Crp/Fnr family transcriptional regulator [Listeria booriae]MBC2284251.1 Crp/Fnr family transcriptional regulator [Listeria booriae]MBC2292385.1 Crp/Fnr family transcriptional regulator [Listeria booriae]MBC2304425.1 Crp/Fnr family transcriptional regulator [Listeria booriae]MBC2310781.1 Crp/Fnr family transcriptional regulator [Listeria booriae]
MDFLTVHGLLLREPNLLVSLLQKSNWKRRHKSYHYIEVLENGQKALLDEPGSIIHIIEGQLLQQFSNAQSEKDMINAIWTKDDCVFHNVFQPGNYEYIALGDVKLEIYDAKAVLQEISQHPFFPDLLVDAMKKLEENFFQYSKMLTKGTDERITDMIRKLSKKGKEGYHIPKFVNYVLLAKCCQITPRTVKGKLKDLEKSNQIIKIENNRVLRFETITSGL